MMKTPIGKAPARRLAALATATIFVAVALLIGFLALALLSVPSLSAAPKSRCTQNGTPAHGSLGVTSGC